MKKIILNTCTNLIKNNNHNISEEKLEEIQYGLEGIYLTITKTIVIFGVSYIIGSFKEMFLMLIIYNILRTTGFGLHAKKSWHCWVSSIILFIFVPYIAKYIFINRNIKLILGILSIIMMYLYAPADTVKHPLVNKKKRKIWKIITTINCSILVILSLLIKDNNVSNLIIFGIYTQIMVILPISYKILNLPYKNYINYGLNSNV